MPQSIWFEVHEYIRTLRGGNLLVFFELSKEREYRGFEDNVQAPDIPVIVIFYKMK